MSIFWGILAGLVTAASLVAVVVFLLAPMFHDHDVRLVVSMVGGFVSGIFAVRVGFLVHDLAEGDL